jgi:uncharacterized protein (TIGR02186 family)
MNRAAGIAIAAAAFLCASMPARAEKLVTSLSAHRVMITSNFTGVDLTLFGTIETDASSVGRTGGYGLVVTVTGPRQPTITWRKERVMGIWVNAQSRRFVEPPSYLAVLGNRPIDDMASPDVLRRLQTGLAQVQLPQQVGGDIADVNADDPFRAAFVRIKRAQGLYREQANAVTFLTPNLFRTSIPLPANVPIGEYEVDVKLFAAGTMVAQETTAFEIIKAGFEQFVANSARDYGVLYGFATMFMALFTGWLGAIIFRRD